MFNCTRDSFIGFLALILFMWVGVATITFFIGREAGIRTSCQAP